MATSLLSLMNDLIDRLAGLPFAPLIMWATASDQWLGIGLGDLLLAAVFPLVMRKAFGRRAGLPLVMRKAFGRRAGLLAHSGWAWQR